VVERKQLSGLLVLNKPTGMTSRDVVNRVSRPLRPIKVGHAGTLDPLATGVLVIAVGSATRLIEYVQRMPKTYRAVVLLGARSDTDDADGVVTVDDAAREPALEALRAAVAAQTGTILQKPPGYSALKVAGERAYDRARAGQAVDLAPRPIHIDRIEILRLMWPKLELEVSCGGGTYIRAIARDLGDALGCGGLIETLVRTRIGPFPLEDAIDLGTLSVATIPSYLRPAAEAVSSLPAWQLSKSDVSEGVRGRSIVAPSAPNSSELALFGPDGDLVAIGGRDPSGDRIQPRKVLTSG
jgi:tRNA pseudouridine55 synthase